MSEMILFPEYQTLKESVKRLKKEIADLLLERDELRFVICKNIETAYCLKFGALEYKIHEASCMALRLERKIEMVQACINRQEPIVNSELEKMLDEEFKKYLQQMEEMIRQMNEALERDKLERLSDADNEELKRLYRTVVKRLHPDVNPDVTPAQRQLLNHAIEAYKNGDLANLRIIAAMVDDPILDDSQDALGMLREEEKRLKETVEVLNRELDEIKGGYPYNLRDYVDDPDKAERHHVYLEQVLDDYQARIERSRKRLAEMMDGAV